MGPNVIKAMAETSFDRPQKPGFLTTPGEVRNKTYRMLLTMTCAFQEYGYRRLKRLKLTPMFHAASDRQLTLTEHVRLSLYEFLALIGLGETIKCREALKDLVLPMTNTRSRWDTWQEEVNVDNRPGKGQSQFHLSMIVLHRLNDGVLLNCPPDVEENSTRGVDVRGSSTVYAELDAILEYCLNGAHGVMRSVDVKVCLLDREELAFPIGEGWSRIASKIQTHQRLMARCDQN